MCYLVWVIRVLMIRCWYSLAAPLCVSSRPPVSHFGRIPCLPLLARTYRFQCCAAASSVQRSIVYEIGYNLNPYPNFPPSHCFAPKSRPSPLDQRFRALYTPTRLSELKLTGHLVYGLLRSTNLAFRRALIPLTTESSSLSIYDMPLCIPTSLMLRTAWRA